MKLGSFSDTLRKTLNALSRIPVMELNAAGAGKHIQTETRQRKPFQDIKSARKYFKD